jgi:tryptophan synthase alpha chain
VDGVLALDLPIEEAGEFRETMAASGIDTIFPLSPTTTDDRIRKAGALGRGFLRISRLGVTGARDQVRPRSRDGAPDSAITTPDRARIGISRPDTSPRSARTGRGRRRQRAGFVDCGGGPIADLIARVGRHVRASRRLPTTRELTT